MPSAVDRLAELHHEGRFLITAHRGLSGCFPENTLPAFEGAVRCGADLVEFDIHTTRDGVPVILHDATLDRTTDGRGAVADCALSQVREFNAAYWSGPHDTGQRLAAPAMPGVCIPTLDETLATLTGRVALNMQVKVDDRASLATIAAAYRRHGLYGSAYLMVRDFDVALAFRAMDPAIELCVGRSRNCPAMHAEFGLRLLQPTRAMVTDDFAREVCSCGLWAHVFYVNREEDLASVRLSGIAGVLTDCSDRLVGLTSGASKT